MEENKVLKITLDEIQQELENLVSEHESLTNQMTEQQSQLREAQEQPGKLRLEAQGIRDKLYEKEAEVENLQGEIKDLTC